MDLCWNRVRESVLELALAVCLHGFIDFYSSVLPQVVKQGLGLLAAGTASELLEHRPPLEFGMEKLLFLEKVSTVTH